MGVSATVPFLCFAFVLEGENFKFFVKQKLAFVTALKANATAPLTASVSHGPELNGLQGFSAELHPGSKLVALPLCRRQFCNKSVVAKLCMTVIRPSERSPNLTVSASIASMRQRSCSSAFFSATAAPTMKPAFWAWRPKSCCSSKLSGFSGGPPAEALPLDSAADPPKLRPTSWSASSNPTSFSTAWPTSFRKAYTNKVWFRRFSLGGGVIHPALRF